MTLKKLKLSVLFFVLLLTNLTVQSMEEENIEKCEMDENGLSSIERLPDELLLLIFQYKIHDTINTNDAIQSSKEFRDILIALCLANKKFYGFKNILKQYFAKFKKLEISNVKVDLIKYIISFEIGDIRFKSDANDVYDLQFINNIVDQSITAEMLTMVGEELVKKAIQFNDLIGMAGDILRAEYDKATTADSINLSEQLNRIRALVKPILIAYKDTPVPSGKAANYYTISSVYPYLLEGFYGSDIPKDLL